ncbi:MAG: hypothetical protein PHD70_07230 [Anaerostipes sp.]|nr:hypothetical protein [Anaerostipes sp.]
MDKIGRDSKQMIEVIMVTFFKIYFLIYLFIPVICSSFSYVAYYPEFILANVVLFVFGMIYILWLVYNREFTKRNFIIATILIVSIVGYSIFYIQNMHVIKWNHELKNVILSFSIVVLLLIGKNENWIEKRKIIQFTTACILISNIVGIIIYKAGYMSIWFLNWKLQTDTLESGKNYFGEYRFNWLYFHKSEYALMVLLFLAFLLINSERFFEKKLRGTIVFALGICVLIYSLYISHVNTSIVGGILMIVGKTVYEMYLRCKKSSLWIKTIISICSLAVIGSSARMILEKIARERNLSTLGSRSEIWKASIKVLKENYLGIGTAYNNGYRIPIVGAFTVNNAHNVFLNEMLRFSVPVGVCFTIAFVAIIVISLVRNFNIFTVSIWVALLAAMNMDYCMLPQELSMVLIMLYLIFFYPKGKKVRN